MPAVVGQPQPPFSGIPLGSFFPFALAAHSQRTVVVMFRGLTWCPPCQQTIPLVNAAWQQVQSSGIDAQFVIIALPHEPGAGDPSLPQAVVQLGVTVPVIPDSQWTIFHSYFSTVVGLPADVHICPLSGPAKPGATGIVSHIHLGFDSGYLSEFLYHIHACTPKAPPLLASTPELSGKVLFGVADDSSGLVLTGGGIKKVPPWDPVGRATTTINLDVPLATSPVVTLDLDSPRSSPMMGTSPGQQETSNGGFGRREDGGGSCA
jgi:hypothetical protein